MGVILLHNLWILLFKFEGMKKYRGITKLTLIEIEKNDMSTKKKTKSMTFFLNEAINVIKKQKPSWLEK